ncbi:type II toxin-antitoxin system VapC family toxin [Algoriphagus sp. A40]|uniref:type II toxin-antitoxin system VapC family toxin n=1 Tax=Algoriphagus sp. A40 TaxID=1945863 RepID=UPI0009876A2B|nr:type II toxin-antitoxin system VapC family toxin [Algoriphagus sp. A40]OOG70467.1 hypothetical protein B0E43_17830 [Algoriphagus sp. A40]
MNFLIDTHALLWFLSNDPLLPIKTKNLIETSEVCLVSVATIWEIGIKESSGKLELEFGFERLIEIIKESGFTILPITLDHVSKNHTLEYYHRDPFDRILIAQAICENLVLISKDSEFQNYGVPVVWN